MKKFSDNEYKIYENLAQAKSILRKNGGSIEDDEFLHIADTTNKDGWTGLLTRLVYQDGVDLDEVIGIYQDLKKSKLNLAELSKMEYDDIIDTLYSDSSNNLDNGVKFAARSGDYLIFHVKTFEDGLKICSPAWCLKTKSHWEDYTTNGYQFVVIQDGYVNKNGKTKLLTPDSKGYFGNYKNNMSPHIRYGISVKIGDKFKVFDDDNKTIDPYKLPKGILGEITNYIKNDKFELFRRKKIYNGEDEYDYIKGEITFFILNDKDEREVNSWDYNVDTYRKSGVYDYDSAFDRFIQFSIEQNIDMYEFYEKYRSEIIDDYYFTNSSGKVDYILYRLSGNKNHDNGGLPLSGMWLRERQYTDHSFKYTYGFSLNKYGRMYILQSYDSIEEWYKTILLDFSKIFLDRYESHGSYNTYGDSVLFRWIYEWTGEADVIDIFFHLNVSSNKKYCSRVFFINEFIETITNWIYLKNRLLDDNDLIARVTKDNSIDKNLLVREMVQMSDCASHSRISYFMDCIPFNIISSEINTPDVMSELSKEYIMEFFSNALLIDKKSKTNNTIITLEENKNSSEKSDDCMVIQFWYEII